MTEVALREYRIYATDHSGQTERAAVQVDAGELSRSSGPFKALEEQPRLWRPRSESRRRLESEVRLRAIRLDALMKESARDDLLIQRDESRCTHLGSNRIHEAALSELKMHVDEAFECSQHGSRINEGWAHLFTVDEALIQTYGTEQLRSAALVLAAEVSGTRKISQWRRDAVQDLLRPFLPQGTSSKNGKNRFADTKPSPCIQRQREALKCATKLRDEGVSNGYWLLSIVLHHDIALLIIGGIFQVAFLVLLYFWLAQQPAARSLDDWHAPLMAICAGVLGAVVSAAQRSTKFRVTSIPRQLTSNLASISRIPLGTVAGLTTWLVVLATSTSALPMATTGIIANLLLAAFGAGFAERLVVGTTAQTRESDPRPEVPQKPGSV